MPPKIKTSEPSEADVIFTRASVALAKSQRLIASWLPPKPDAEIARDGGAAENDDEDLETGNELLGVGAAPPATDGGKNILKRKDPSLDALRKQLLGRNASKISATTGHRAAPASAHVTGRVSGRPGATTARPSAGLQDESDSEEGRAGMFGKRAKGGKGKRNGKVKEGVRGGDEEDMSGAAKGDREVGGDGDEEPVEAENQALPSKKPSKRKATSYLDEILAEKSAKKKKKKKAKGTGAAATATTTTTEEPS